MILMAALLESGLDMKMDFSTEEIYANLYYTIFKYLVELQPQPAAYS